MKKIIIPKKYEDDFKKVLNGFDLRKIKLIKNWYGCGEIYSIENKKLCKLTLRAKKILNKLIGGRIFLNYIYWKVKDDKVVRKRLKELKRKAKKL
ncbi:MAG: hypothetical protein ABIM49_02280 [candidate division WOR-3 bacterium]